MESIEHWILFLPLCLSDLFFFLYFFFGKKRRSDLFALIFLRYFLLNYVTFVKKDNKVFRKNLFSDGNGFNFQDCHNNILSTHWIIGRVVFCVGIEFYLFSVQNYQFLQIWIKYKNNVFIQKNCVLNSQRISIFCQYITFEKGVLVESNRVGDVNRFSLMKIFNIFLILRNLYHKAKNLKFILYFI